MKTSNFPIAILSLIFLFVLGCKSDKPPTELESGVFVEYMDTTIRPGNNFYQYANGNWIKNTEIPPKSSSYWMGTLLFEKSMQNTQKIIQEAKNAKAEDDPAESLIGSLYNSFMDTVSRQSRGTEFLETEFAKIDALDNTKSLMAYFAYAAKYKINSPFMVPVFEDLMDPSLNTLYIEQSGISLPDRKYYLSNDANTANTRADYQDHIVEMFNLSGVDCDRSCVADIVSMEKSLATFQNSMEDNRDQEKVYNPYTLASLNATYPPLDWNLFLNELGASGVKTVVIRQPDFVKGVAQLTTSESLEKWKKYLKWKVLYSYSEYFQGPLGEAHFQFFGKNLQGIQQQPPLQERASRMVGDLLSEALSKIYVNQYFSPETKSQMDSLVSILQLAFQNRIEKASWMSPETREKALFKLSKMDAQIGYPDRWRDLSDIQLDAEDFFGNYRILRKSQHDDKMAKAGKSVDDDGWYRPAHMPMGWFNQSRNTVVFTAALLQPPLFNLGVDDAALYGVLGGLIGHEMTHGFDDEGGSFDETGVMKNWWSPASETTFKERSEMLVHQYNEFTVLDSLHLNGTATLGENIADLGSLNIALEAYKLSLNGSEAPVIDGYTGLQRVFLGYAQVWRSKYREEALRRSVQSGHHPPRMFRVNGVVRNIDAFYEAFDISPTDSLYLPPEKRVVIW
jgi:putative endopeptidase